MILEKETGSGETGKGDMCQDGEEDRQQLKPDVIQNRTINTETTESSSLVFVSSLNWS